MKRIRFHWSLPCLIAFPALLAAQTDPAALRIGVDLIARLQAGGTGSRREPADAHGLYRTRLSLDARSASGAGFVFEAQDSGTIVISGTPPESDHFDIQQAFFDLARRGRRWRFRLGRQEMAFGDERLIGSDSEWCYLGRSFDAARASYVGEKVRMDWFASFPVSHIEGRWNRPQFLAGLHGFDSTWALSNGAGEAGVYWMWRSDRAQGGGNRYTSGARHAATLPGGFETNVEVARQSGRMTGERVRAWAAHAEAGRKLWTAKQAPSLAVESNYATGDSVLDDGVNARFDDLFPAGHDKYGLPDPFPWSNIRSVGFSAEWSQREQLQIAGGWRRVRPAAGGSLENRGSQIAISAAYRISEHWSLYAAYSRFFQAPASPSNPLFRSSFFGVRRRF